MRGGILKNSPEVDKKEIVEGVGNTESSYPVVLGVFLDNREGPVSGIANTISEKKDPVDSLIVF